MSQLYELNDVKKWFGGLPIIDDLRTNKHLESLRKYGDNPVNSTDTKSATAWHRIFNECLLDLENINNDSVERYRVKFNEEYRKFTSDLNLNLNTMTKKDFVELFAGVMKDIFTKEKVEELKKIQQNYYTPRPWEEEELNTVNNDIGSGARFGITTGGSKKKSNKRIRRKRRDSHRNKTRKYKKRN